MRYLHCLSLFALAVAGPGCLGEELPDRARPDAAPTADAGGQPVAVGSLCIRGEPEPLSGEEILDLDSIGQFEVRPLGCFSSSCTIAHELGCRVLSQDGLDLQLEASLRLEQVPGACTPDCGGGGLAICRTQTGLELTGNSSYTVTLGELELEFEVPSRLPPGGLCTP